MSPQRWILLLAVSSGAQASEDKDSLPSQERDLKAHVDSVGGVVVDIIRIPGHSRDFYTWQEFAEAASKGKNPTDDPKRMIQHWKAQDFDVLGVREPSRFGRKIGMVAEVIGKTLDAGATVFPLSTRTMITSANGLTSSMVEGYVANQELNTLKARTKMGMEKRVSRGLPAGKTPVTHTLVRDEKTGKAIKLVANPLARLYFTQAAHLLLDGLPYDIVQERLHSEGYQLPGLKYNPRLLYRLLWKPSFWGHSAQYFTQRRGADREKAGLWMLDAASPAPSTVKIIYDTHEPVLTGDIGQRLKDEMRRRMVALRGTAHPRSITKFAGLISCDECGRSVARGYTSKYPGSDTYRCATHYAPKLGIPCSQSLMISERKICAWVDKLLIQLIEDRDYSLLIPQEGDATRDYDHLTACLSEAETRLNRLIDGQSRAPATVFDHYSAQIETVAQEIAGYRRGLLTLEGQMHQGSAYREAIDQAIQPMRAVLPQGLWTLPIHEINQFLFNVLGPWTLSLREGEIVGFQERRRKKERQKR